MFELVVDLARVSPLFENDVDADSSLLTFLESIVYVIPGSELGRTVFISGIKISNFFL